MNSRFVPVPAPIAAEYMSAKLAEVSELSVEVLVEGTFFVFAPNEGTQDELNNLRDGGMVGTEGGGASIVQALAKYIAYEWPKRGSWGYFADPFAVGAPSDHVDKALTKIKTNYYFGLALRNDTHEEDILPLIRKYTSAWQFLAILSCTDTQQLYQQGSFDPILSIVVDAYDGESFLVWCRCEKRR